MGELTLLPNIGPELERQLNTVDIFTANDLQVIGSQKAWLKIKKLDASACYNRLLALEAAIQGISKNDLTISDKQILKSFYQLSIK